MVFEISKQQKENLQLEDLKKLIEKLEDSSADLEDFKKLDRTNSKLSETEKKLFEELDDKEWLINFLKWLVEILENNLLKLEQKNIEDMSIAEARTVLDMIIARYKKNNFDGFSMWDSLEDSAKEINNKDEARMFQRALIDKIWGEDTFYKWFTDEELVSFNAKKWYYLQNINDLEKKLKPWVEIQNLEGIHAYILKISDWQNDKEATNTIQKKLVDTIWRKELEKINDISLDSNNNKQALKKLRYLWFLENKNTPSKSSSLEELMAQKIDVSDDPIEIKKIKFKDVSEMSLSQAKTMLEYTNEIRSEERIIDLSSILDTAGDFIDEITTTDNLNFEQKKYTNIYQQELIDKIYWEWTFSEWFSWDSIVCFDSNKWNYLKKVSIFEQELKNKSILNRKDLATYTLSIIKKNENKDEIRKNIQEKVIDKIWLEKTQEFLSIWSDDIHAKKVLEELVSLWIIEEWKWIIEDLWDWLKQLMWVVDTQTKIMQEEVEKTNWFNINTIYSSINVINDEIWATEDDGARQEANKLKNKKLSFIKGKIKSWWQESENLANWKISPNAPKEVKKLQEEAKLQEFWREFEEKIPLEQVTATLDIFSNLPLSEGLSSEQSQKLYEEISAAIINNTSEIDTFQHLREILKWKDEISWIWLTIRYIYNNQIEKIAKQKHNIVKEVNKINQKKVKGEEITSEEQKLLSQSSDLISTLTKKENALEKSSYIMQEPMIFATINSEIPIDDCEKQINEAKQSNIYAKIIKENAKNSWLVQGFIQAQKIFDNLNSTQEEIENASKIVNDFEEKTQESAKKAVVNNNMSFVALSNKSKWELKEKTKKVIKSKTSKIAYQLKKDRQLLNDEKIQESLAATIVSNWGMKNTDPALTKIIENSTQFNKIKQKIEKQKEIERKIKKIKQKYQKENTNQYDNKKPEEQNTEIENKNYSYNSKSWEIIINSNLGEEKIIEVKDSEKKALKNPEARQNYVEFYKTLEELWVSWLWQYREEISSAIWNTNSSLNFRQGFLNKNEQKIFLNAILKSIGKIPIKMNKSLNEFKNIFSQQRNNQQIWGWFKNDSIKTWSSEIEEMFFKKFILDQSIFPTAKFKKTII